MSDQPPRPTPPESDPDGTDNVSLADITERLLTEFDGRLNLATIVDVVRRARRDLDIAQGDMLPEMLERLAHQRLTDLTESSPMNAAADDSDRQQNGEPEL